MSGTPSLFPRCSASPASLVEHLSHSHVFEDWLFLLSVQVVGVRGCSQLPPQLFRRAAPAVVESSSHSSKRRETQPAGFELVFHLLSRTPWPGDRDCERKHSACHRTIEMGIVNAKFSPVWCWVQNCLTFIGGSVPTITVKRNGSLNWAGAVLSPGDVTMSGDILNCFKFATTA